MDTGKPADFAGQLEKLRGLASQITPLAFSVDGRTFGYELPVVKALPIGSYVMLRAPAGPSYFGQITSVDVTLRDGPGFGVKTMAEGNILFVSQKTEGHFTERARIRYALGGGDILGRQADDGGLTATGPGDVFENATIEAANAEAVASYLAAKKTKDDSLDIGFALFLSPGDARVHLNPAGFLRHTFLCGQSRSGKSFALGSIVEQLLIRGSTPMLILDPNSDFQHLKQFLRKEDIEKRRAKKLSPQEYDEFNALFAGAESQIRIARLQGGDEPLRIRFSDLDRTQQATLLQLHPVRDLTEFSKFATMIDSVTAPYSLKDIFKKLTPEVLLQSLRSLPFLGGDIAALSETAVRMTSRIENLGISDWAIWADKKESSVIDSLKQRNWRALVLDIGPIPPGAQKAVMSLAVLNQLWENKDAADPVLIVIDEAHNVCPKDPANDLEAMATDCVARIAGEGLKYGLRLLISSQWPAKIHPNVSSQCENLILMRMSSRADIDHLIAMFSQVPPSLLNRSPYFTQGQALITGGIVPSATFAKFDTRLTMEGGADPAAKRNP